MIHIPFEPQIMNEGKRGNELNLPPQIWLSLNNSFSWNISFSMKKMGNFSGTELFTF